MPVRIYSLAKELKLDSKVLVDICTAAGVTGKGSALASLTDEEAERVKAYMAGGSVAKAAPRPRPSAAATIEAPEAAAVRREDYIAPTGTLADKVPVLGDRAKAKKKPTNGETPKAAPAKATPPKLAPLPTVAEPVVPPPPAEVAQKPDLRLPIDAIKAASRGGSKPLIDHVRKQQGKRRDEEPRRSAAGPAGACRASVRRRAASR